jgi:hypothetical protein
LVPDAIHHRERSGARPHDDDGPVVAPMGAGSGDVDVVKDLGTGKGPGTLAERLSRRGQPSAGQPETGISVGGLGEIEPCTRKNLAAAFRDRAEGSLAALDLEIGAAAGGVGERRQMLIGKPDAAVRAAAIHSEIILRQIRGPDCFPAFRRGGP